MSRFQFARRRHDTIERTEDLAVLLGAEDLANERWLFVSPHDDDAVMGGGLWTLAGLAAGVDVRLMVVTDGRMGYCTPEEKENIVSIRKQEVRDSSRILGMEDEKHVQFLGYPDCGLYQQQGRRRAEYGELEIEGHTGLVNSFTYHLRRVRPTRVFVPAPTDLHPDHQIVHNELMICLFHASGQIWPELGDPLDVPALYEMAVYCDFAAPPNLQVVVDDKTFERKIEAIAAYKSQLQIEQLLSKLRDAGPQEYLREADFKFYDPSAYHHLFE